MNTDPNQFFKRKHYGTPQSILLIITNYIVFAMMGSIFASCTSVNWFFWVSMGCLAIYNFFNVRKDREEYDKARIIAYVISIVIMVFMFIIYRLNAQKC